jgi:hypothetical protein
VAPRRVGARGGADREADAVGDEGAARALSERGEGAEVTVLHHLPGAVHAPQGLGRHLVVVGVAEDHVAEPIEERLLRLEREADRDQNTRLVKK